MRKSYLFIYNTNVGFRDKIKKIIDQMTTVITWRYDMPNMFYIISENSAHEIAKEFESHNGTKGRFLILEFQGNAQGRLLPESWYLLRNKKHKEK